MNLQTRKRIDLLQELPCISELRFHGLHESSSIILLYLGPYLLVTIGHNFLFMSTSPSFHPSLYPCGPLDQKWCCLWHSLHMTMQSQLFHLIFSMKILSLLRHAFFQTLVFIILFQMMLFHRPWSFYHPFYNI